MAEQEIGQIRVFLTYQFFQLMLVLHHGMAALVSPVAPGVILQGGLAMAYVVVGRHDESGVHEPHDHMQIPPGMLAVAVDHLNDALRLCRRDIDPSIDLVPLVE